MTNIRENINDKLVAVIDEIFWCYIKGEVCLFSQVWDFWQEADRNKIDYVQKHFPNIYHYALRGYRDF